MSFDKTVQKKSVFNFLKKEYQVKEFMERILNHLLNCDISESVKNGVAIEFLNALRPDHITKYDTKPKTIHHEINNIKIFNEKATKEFGIASVDNVDPMRVTDTSTIAQLTNILYRIISFSQKHGYTKVQFTETIPEFSQAEVKRAAEIVQVEIPQVKQKSLPMVDNRAEEAGRKNQKDLTHLIAHDTLVLRVINGKFYEKQDLFGPGDPYVIVLFNNQKLKTKTFKNTMSAVFNEVFSFSLDRTSIPPHIEFQLWDEDYTFIFDNDDFVGRAIIGNIPEYKNKNTPINLKVMNDKKKATGEINVEVEWIAPYELVVDGRK